LNLWISALGSANTGGLNIKFVSESGSGSRRTVTYIITGSTGVRSVTTAQLIQTVHQSVGGLRSRVTVGGSGSFGSGGSLQFGGGGSQTIQIGGGGFQTQQISGGGSWTVTGSGSGPIRCTGGCGFLGK